MSEMIERVARALHGAAYHPEEDPVKIAHYWDDFGALYQDGLREKARAAIAAMATIEHSRAVRDAGIAAAAPCEIGPAGVTRVFNAMIAAHLENLS